MVDTGVVDIIHATLRTLFNPLTLFDEELHLCVFLDVFCEQTLWFMAQQEPDLCGFAVFK